MSKCPECSNQCELGMPETYLTNNGVLHRITQCVKNLKSQLAKAREEIEQLQALVIAQGPERRENEALKAKLSKLERVRVAAEEYRKEIENPVPDFAYRRTLRDQLFKALAALRETEER